MSRRALDTALLGLDSPSVTYQVSLEPQVVEAVRTSVTISAMSWPEWVDAALARLQRESEEELHNLLADPKPSSRKGKKNLSFRVSPQTLALIKKLAADHDSTVQVLLTHAFFMQSLADFE